MLSAKDMADKNVEHLGVMAYAAHFQWVPERPPLFDLINVRLESTSGRVGEPVSPIKIHSNAKIAFFAFARLDSLSNHAFGSVAFV